MAVVLGHNQYGKAENRVVRVFRDRDPHELAETFAGHHSLALQHTLYEMGSAVLAGQPEIAEIRFSAPNKHHFAYGLARFGLDNDNEVFHADDRPYGLIEATVRRDDAPEVAGAFDPGQGW